MNELIKMMGSLLFILKTKDIITETDYQLILGKITENEWLEIEDNAVRTAVGFKNKKLEEKFRSLKASNSES